MEYEPVLEKLLTSCFQCGRLDYGAVVINYFSKANTTERDLPLFTELFTYKSFNDDLLAFIAKIDPMINSIDHITNLIEWKDTSSQMSVAEKLLKVMKVFPMSGNLSL